MSIAVHTRNVSPMHSLVSAVQMPASGGMSGLPSGVNSPCVNSQAANMPPATTLKRSQALPLNAS
jgi:hypothetical protein